MIPIKEYKDIVSNQRVTALFNRELTFDTAVEETVRGIIANVRARGDAALIDYTAKYDGIRLDSIIPVAREELKELHSHASSEFIGALRKAISNVRSFHNLQIRNDIWVEKEDGVRMGLRFVPLSSVGLYVPGGAGAYPSTIVMNAVPAQAAGVERIIAVTPPGQFRKNPHVAAAFVELGITEVYTIGGAQAVAALAYGTESVPKVDKIVGPGNMYVAIAKRLVYGQVDIDMFAGPSEIVVVADETARPDYVAADLLSQAEHGSGMEMAVLLTPSRYLASAVQKELYRQAETLPNAEKILDVLEKNVLIVVKDLDEAVDAVNCIAPEHLELMVSEPERLLGKIKNAGAIFLGYYSPEPISDYFGGTNHVLPTSGAARYASPLGVYDFQKCSNIVKYTRQAVFACCDKVQILALAEGFEAHARSVAIRCKEKP
jgi:histidinol dehydrogenase